MNSLEEQIVWLQDQVKKTYSKLNKKPYHLHAICIHDGSAESGHYFTLIKDHHQGIWRKFNDVKVNEVSEEEVFKWSVGGYGAMTAYWLVYISDKRQKEHKGTDFNSYSADPSSKANSGSVYGSIIPAEIDSLIEAENQKVITEAQNFKANELAK